MMLNDSSGLTVPCRVEYPCQRDAVRYNPLGPSPDKVIAYPDQIWFKLYCKGVSRAPLSQRLRPFATRGLRGFAASAVEIFFRLNDLLVQNWYPTFRCMIKIQKLRVVARPEADFHALDVPVWPGNQTIGGVCKAVI
jgi:hypothetical protein